MCNYDNLTSVKQHDNTERCGNHEDDQIHGYHCTVFYLFAVSCMWYGGLY